MPGRIVAICKRYERYIVSEAITTERGQPGYSPADNWQALEPLALAEVQAAPFGGPFVYPCSPGLALQAFFHDAPIVAPLLDDLPSTPLQPRLWDESEASR